MSPDYRQYDRPRMLTVLKLAAAGRTPAWIGEATHEDPAYITAVLDLAGYPDLGAVNACIAAVDHDALEPLPAHDEDPLAHMFARLRPEDVERAAELHAAGRTIVDIADMLHVSDGTLTVNLQRYHRDQRRKGAA